MACHASLAKQLFGKSVTKILLHQKCNKFEFTIKDLHSLIYNIYPGSWPERPSNRCRSRCWWPISLSYDSIEDMFHCSYYLLIIRDATASICADEVNLNLGSPTASHYPTTMSSLFTDDTLAWLYVVEMKVRPKNIHTSTSW